MTRYEIVRDMSKGPQCALANYERHPEQPEEGFEYATTANLWAVERNLDGAWYIAPREATND